MNRVQRKLAAKFAEAMARHEACDMAAAETQYRALLADKPNHADALHMLGLLHFQTGRPEPAIDLIRNAITHHPKNTAFHANLGRILNETKRFEEAAEVYAQAARLDPRSAEAHTNRAVALTALGRGGGLLRGRARPGTRSS